MKTLPDDLAAHLDGAATTLAQGWRLTRADAAVLGFTDHDRPIRFDGVDFQAMTGLGASEAVAGAGLGAGGRELLGALSSAAISEDDIAAGLYDGATVEVYLVNWAAPAERVKLSVGRLGEVTRSDGAFKAEVRSLAAELDQPRGRLYQHRCDADLGDERCGVDLSAGDLQGAGVVAGASDGRRIVAGGLGAFAPHWFDRGRLSFTSGANAGLAMEVRAHGPDGPDIVIDLWQPMPRAIAVGDGFTVTAGCDKRFETCVARFGNGERFRGFPHIPGSDFLIANPSRSSGANTGAALTP